MPKALITGSAGFVGPYLARHLKSLGYEVWGASLAGSAGEHYLPIALDVRRAGDVAHVMTEVGPDEVYHLAGISRPALDDVASFYDVNLYGTLHVLQGATAVGASVLVVSSAYIYGKHNKPTDESTPLEPVNHYGVSKAAGDLAAISYAVEGLQVVRARPFNHTGPGQSPDFVLPSLVHQVSRIEMGLDPPIIKLGNVESVRDITDVRDIVRAYPLLLHKGKSGEAYNLATGHGISVRDLAERALRLTKRPVEIEIEASRMRASDIPFLVGNASKVRKLGWAAKYTLDRTLRDMFDFELGKLMK